MKCSHFLVLFIIYLFVYYLFIYYPFETDSRYVSQLRLNLQLFYLSLPGAEITSGSHHTQLREIKSPFRCHLTLPVTYDTLSLSSLILLFLFSNLSQEWNFLLERGTGCKVSLFPWLPCLAAELCCFVSCWQRSKCWAIATAPGNGNISHFICSTV